MLSVSLIQKSITISDHEYQAVASTDRGLSWSRPESVRGAGCVRPKLLSLDHVTLLSGGRLCTENVTDNFVWVAKKESTDDDAWRRYSLSAAHNELWAGAPSLRFTDSVNTTDASGRTLATLSYTSLLKGADGSATVVYGMYANYQGVQGANLAFSMRLRVKSDDEPKTAASQGCRRKSDDVSRVNGRPKGFFVLDPSTRAAALHTDTYEWAVANVPFVDLPGLSDIEDAYYFRWRIFHRHLINTPQGYVVTEFLPQVPWAGRFNTIPDAAGHHIMEGRWTHNASFIDDYLSIFFAHGPPETAWRSYTAWFAYAAWERHLVRGDAQSKDFLGGLFPALVENLRAWNATHRSSYGGRWCWWQSDGLDAMEVSISGSGCRPTINSVMWGEATALLNIAAMIDADNATLLGELKVLQSQARSVVLDHGTHSSRHLP